MKTLHYSIIAILTLIVIVSNAVSVQADTTVSPLKQFQSGISISNIQCAQDLSLVIKAEDYTPACVQPDTATKLVQRGWALGTTSPMPSIKKMWITGLQNYTIGQPINATVNYDGYYWYAEPNVKILDANGTQIWFNCPYCYMRTEMVPSPSFGTFTYHVREYSSNTQPVINKTGTYMMVASFDNETAQANFTVINSGNHTLPDSFEPCETPFPQNYTGIAVLYMPANSTGKLCVMYHNLNDFPAPVGIRIFAANNMTGNTTDITTWNDDESNTIPKGDSMVVYWVKTGNHAGFYELSLFCEGMPFVVGYDNNSTIAASDFPWIGKMFSCPMLTYDFHIDSTTGIGVRYIPHP